MSKPKEFYIPLMDAPEYTYRPEFGAFFHVIEYSEMKRISDLYDRRLNNHQKAYMNLEVDFKELQAQADKLAEALTQANELMEKLINGDKFHQEYLLKTQAMADKALEKLK